MTPARRNEPRRILYLDPSATMGGAERCLLELIRSLPRERYEAHVILPESGPFAAAARAAGANVSVEPWPWPLSWVGRRGRLLAVLLLPVAALRAIPVMLRLSRYVRSHRIDLLHSNGTKAHFLGCGLALLTGKPLVWHLRDVMAPGPLATALRVVGGRIPRRVIANSAAMERSVWPDGPSPRVVRISDGIDPSEFTPGPPDPALRKELGIAPDRFVVGIAGALAPYKGHLYLIEAMPRILEHVDEALLLIVGDVIHGTMGHGSYRSELEAKVAALGLGDRILFAGWRADVTPFYRIMDVVILGSVLPESFGRILVEAMACERPVIATDIGASPEILSGTDCGILVPPRDVAAMADAVIALHRDASRRQRMGRLGRARVAESFPLERNVAGITALYEEILSDLRRAAGSSLGHAASPSPERAPRRD